MSDIQAAQLDFLLILILHTEQLTDLFMTRRSELWEGSRLERCLRGGAATMATHDWQPWGPARVHTDAAIQHGQEEDIERKSECFPGNTYQIRSPLDTLKCSLCSLAVLIRTLNSQDNYIYTHICTSKVLFTPGINIHLDWDRLSFIPDVNIFLKCVSCDHLGSDFKGKKLWFDVYIHLLCQCSTACC